MQAGPLELLGGDAVAAERELRPAYEALERMGNWGSLSSIVPPLVDALLAQERDDQAFRLTEISEHLSVPEDVDAQVGWRRVRAKALARRGAVEEAERLARSATARAECTDYLDLHAQATADLGEVLWLAGRLQESVAALGEAIGLHERKGNVVAAAKLRALLAERQIEV